MHGVLQDLFLHQGKYLYGFPPLKYVFMRAYFVVTVVRKFAHFTFPFVILPILFDFLFDEAERHKLHSVFCVCSLLRLCVLDKR